MPLPMVPGRNTEGAISTILRTAYENKVATIVVGLPVNEDGSLNTQSFKVKDFVKHLKVRTKIPVVLVDESMTTKEALRKAVNFGVSQKGRTKLDSLAAEIVLKRYFEDHK